MQTPSLDALVATYCDPEQDDAAQQQALGLLQLRITLGGDDAAAAASAASASASASAHMEVSSPPEPEDEPEDEPEPPAATISLQQLVGRMETPLTSADDKTRHRATLLLAELLHSLGPRAGATPALAAAGVGGAAGSVCVASGVGVAGGASAAAATVVASLPTMSSASLHLFIVFFLHRLRDYPSLLPSLHALTALLSRFGHCLDVKYCDVEDVVVSLHRCVCGVLLVCLSSFLIYYIPLLL